VNQLDVFLLLIAGSAAFGGWRVGFTARALSWAGMAVGLLLASRLLPTIVRWFRESDQVALLMVIFGFLLLGAVLGQVVGYLVGMRLRHAIPRGPADSIDRAGGAVAGVAGVAISFWLILPAMANTPNWPAQQARGSKIAELINEHLPQPPDAIVALRRLIGDDTFPQVFEGLRAAPDLGPPPAQSGLDEATANRVARSTVRVEASACSRRQEGSGAVVGPDEIVTNAHVVAGSSRTTVERHPDGAVLDAVVVAFDPNRDVAILRVSGMDRPALPIDPSDPARGAVGAVFGHPRGGPLAIQPYQVGDVVTARGHDIYDGATTERRVLFLSASLAPGDSGGPLVDPRGMVVGVAFAIAPDRAEVAYALATSEVTAVMGALAADRVETGPCLS
jgi:S1-C subfamily serine protease